MSHFALTRRRIRDSARRLGAIPFGWLRPSDDAESGGKLEAVADVVLLLYRDDYYDGERAQREGRENACEVIVAKHRNGPVGTLETLLQ
jgi:replicative DNA helicase